MERAHQWARPYAEVMAGTWFTADTHFRHRLVAGLRGFTSTEEHDEAVIARWNETVAPGDVVWHLGDVGMSRGFLPLVAHLNGTVHLVAGNHDKVWPGHRDAHKHQREWLDAGFASVQAFARKRIAGRDVLLSHFPYEADHTEAARHTQYRLRDEGAWLLHGHTHASGAVAPGTRQVHVGLDAWDLRPVPLHAVEALIVELAGLEAAAA